MKPAMLALTLVAFGLGACGSAGAPEDAVEEMFLAAQDGQCEGFGDRFTKDIRDAAGPKLDQMCQQAATEAKTKGNARKLKELHVLNRTENGDQVTLRVQPEFEDGTKEKEEDIRVVKEDGRWRISPVK